MAPSPSSSGVLEQLFAASAAGDVVEVAVEVANVDSSSSARPPDSVFLANLFDPSQVDPSFTEANPMVVRPHNGSGVLGAQDELEVEDVQYQQDIYFVLVIVTCCLTVLVALSFAIYKTILFLMEVRHTAAAAATGSPDREGGGVAATAAGAAPGEQPHRDNQQAERRQQHPPHRGQQIATSSVEFLSGFLPAAVPARPFLLTSFGLSKDTPPPYDDPPPYHVAISMVGNMDDPRGGTLRSNGSTIRSNRSTHSSIQRQRRPNDEDHIQVLQVQDLQYQDDTEDEERPGQVDQGQEDGPEESGSPSSYDGDEECDDDDEDGDDVDEPVPEVVTVQD